MFEGVVAIHGDKDVEKRLSHSSEFVCASRTGMAKPPSCVVVLESNMDLLIHRETDSEIDAVANGELLVEVGAKGDSVEVAKSLDE